MMKKVMSPGPFRYAILDHLPGNALASQPLALIKLAHLVIDAYQVSTKRPHKPFVLCSLINSRKTYIVIGIPSPQTLKDVYRNSFGISFKEAAIQSGARFKHDGFEESIIEVQKEDINKFLHVLLVILGDHQ
jgi:cell division control protein 45